MTKPTPPRYDRLGHEIKIGDTVFFSPVGYRDVIPGKVLSMSDKMLVLEHEHPNIRNYTTKTKQFYGQVFLDTRGWQPPQK